MDLTNDRTRGFLNRDLLFIVLLAGCSFLLGFGNLITKGPGGIHVWRQADCLSITQNYYTGQTGFWQPAIHNLISDNGTTGLTAGEFPGLYYWNAMLWKVFGKHYSIPRAMNMLLMFLGLFALYRTYLLLSGNLFWSMAWPLLLLSTPVMAEYGSSFLTDAPAFCMALVGWYSVMRFMYGPTGGKTSHLVLAALCFSLAGLLKVSALILYIGTLGMLFLGIFGRDGKRPNLGQWLILLSATVPVVAWYAYAEWFNGVHGGKYTFNSVWPIWKLTGEEIVRVLSLFWEGIAPFVLSPASWPLLALLLLGWPLLMRHVPWRLSLLSVLVLMGVVAYLCLWFQSIDAHDYYFVNAMVLMVVAPVPWLTAKVPVAQWQTRMMRTVGVLLLCFNLFYARQVLDLRHYPHRAFGPKLLSEKTEGILRWTVWDIAQRTQGLEKMDGFLVEHGLTRDHTVIVMPDQTINHTLYLIDRRGLTDYGLPTREEMVQRALDKGMDFMMVLDREAVYATPGTAELRQFIAGSHDHVDLIDLNAYRRSSAMMD